MANRSNFPAGDMPPTADHQHLLLQEIRRHQADTVLMISPQPGHWQHWLSLSGQQSHCMCPEEYTQGSTAACHYDLAVMADVLEHQDKASAAAMISRLRDIEATTLLVSLIPKHAPHWPQQAFFALGLKRLPVVVEHFAIYQFNLKSYKRTPEWLNSKYWAHPERFNQYRW